MTHSIWRAGARIGQPRMGFASLNHPTTENQKSGLSAWGSGATS